MVPVESGGDSIPPQRCCKHQMLRGTFFVCMKRNTFTKGVQVSENLIHKYLRDTHLELADYEGKCFELVDDTIGHVEAGQLLVFAIDNHPDWHTHAVLLIKNRIHDGWCDDPMTIKNYLEFLKPYDLSDFVVDGEPWDFEGITDEQRGFGCTCCKPQARAKSRRVRLCKSRARSLDSAQTPRSTRL